MAEPRPVREDAPAVLALQRAGAMLVGKANCHELGLGMSGINPACGTPRNPYNPTCCAGGSSSGSAAVISAGICAFALGELFRDFRKNFVYPYFHFHNIGTIFLTSELGV